MAAKSQDKSTTVPTQTTEVTVPTTTNPDSVPSLLSVLDSEEIVGAEASFTLTDELRNAVQRGFKATQSNPGGWLRVRIPDKVFRSDGSEWEPSDEECKTILSERENDLRLAAANMGYSFRRQTPKSKDGKSDARVMLYRINPKQTRKGE